jgi:hypothetical protein
MSRDKAGDPRRETIGELLRLTPKSRLWIGGHEVRVRRAIEREMIQCDRPSAGPIDVLLITPISAEEAAYFAEKHLERLSESGMLVLATASTEGNSSRPSLQVQASAALEERGWNPSEQLQFDGGISLTVFTRIAEPRA